jgi:hypothetical protein
MPKTPLRRALSSHEAIISRARSRLPAMPKDETLRGARSFDIGLTVTIQTARMTSVAASSGSNNRRRTSRGTLSNGCLIKTLLVDCRNSQRTQPFVG